MRVLMYLLIIMAVLGCAGSFAGMFVGEFVMSAATFLFWGVMFFIGYTSLKRLN